MNRKIISPLLLTVLASGLALALTGCFLFVGELDDDGDQVSAAAPLFITYVNQSDDAIPPAVFVFAKNAIPGFDEMADGIAWRVMPDLGKGASHMFMLLPMCTVQATWGEGNMTVALAATVGKRYAVVDDPTGIVLIANGNASQSNAIEVSSLVRFAGGIYVQLLNDGRLFMQEPIVAYGQKATFIMEPKLYWGIASEIYEGQLIGSAILNTDVFFEQNLTGIAGATVTLTGSSASGYQFEVINDYR